MKKLVEFKDNCKRKKSVHLFLFLDKEKLYGRGTQMECLALP